MISQLVIAAEPLLGVSGLNHFRDCQSWKRSSKSCLFGYFVLVLLVLFTEGEADHQKLRVVPKIRSLVKSTWWQR